MTVLPGGRFEARRQTLENLSRVAFGFEQFAANDIVKTRSSWMSVDEFDITATTGREWAASPAGEAIPPELRTMLRALLEDRFGLEARIEAKRADVYVLRFVNRNGEPGPGLRRWRGECLGPYTEPAHTVVGPTPRCAFRFDNEVVEARGLTMSHVARIISRIEGLHSDRPIVDGTGTDGLFDLVLSLTNAKPEAGKISILPLDPTSLARDNSTPQVSLDERRPAAIRDAIEKQLGLRLERAKLPMPTLTIERAVRPRDD